MSTITTDYTALLAAAEKQAISSLKQAQEVSLRATKVAVGLIPDAGAPAGLPTPREVVESSFTFANEILTAQKAYALELAEIVSEGTAKFAKPAKKQQQ
jgi:hypothetical protein